jgi:hypothetical protein
MFAITLRLFVGGIGRVSTRYAGRDVVGKADLGGPAGVGAVERTLNREEGGGVRVFQRADRIGSRRGRTAAYGEETSWKKAS